MDLITALKTVESRSHGPYENDWDLLEAAETLAAVLKMINDVLTEQELLDRIQDIYFVSCVGGPLHIVLDDGNVDDENIQWCIDNVETNPHSTEEEGINAEYWKEVTEEVGKALLALPLERRIELYENNWGM